jgi:hypothetical protein
MRAIKTVVIPNENGDIPKIFAAIHLTSLQLNQESVRKKKKTSSVEKKRDELSSSPTYDRKVVIKKNWRFISSCLSIYRPIGWLLFWYDGYNT